jgi:hypothetical protein
MHASVKRFPEKGGAVGMTITPFVVIIIPSALPYIANEIDSPGSPAHSVVG